MRVNIRYDFGCKLVCGDPGKYGHSFGGDFRYAGTIPESCAMPVHLLFRLDLSDPVVPFRLDTEFRYLPFFFPFSYDASPMSYRVLSDNAIEILSLENSEYIVDCPYPGFPQFFDLVPVRVEPVAYEEQRDLVMAGFLYQHSSIRSAIPSDELQRLGRFHHPYARIGHVHDRLQLPRGEPCPNLACENHTVRFCLDTIATIPEKPFRDLDLWQADGPTVQIVYEICSLCGSIRTYSTYD